MFKILKPFAGPLLVVALEVGLSMTDYYNTFIGGVLLGIFIFWLVMALFGNRALMKRFPGILEWMPFLDPSGGFATADQLTKMFRLRQLPYPATSVKRPQYFGVLTKILSMIDWRQAFERNYKKTSRAMKLGGPQ